MSGNYQGQRGGGGAKKDFKADAVNAYLKNRCVMMSYVKDMVDGKVLELNQFGDYADRMTVTLYGQLDVDPKVTAELMRVAARIQARDAKANGDKKPLPRYVCPSCQFGKQAGTDECNNQGDYTKCNDFQEIAPERENDLNNHAANETTALAEEQARLAAEVEEAGNKEPVDTTSSDEPVTYKCGSCDKTYKTLKGLECHDKKEHV